jgi:hypothetical protein
MKISIFAPTEMHAEINQMISSVDRLDELVYLTGTALEDDTYILVMQKNITVLLDWYNELPPVLYPSTIPFEKNALLGLIFARLENFEEAYSYLQEYPDLLFCVDILNRLQGQTIFTNHLIAGFEKLNNTDPTAALHNLAICYHYGDWEQQISIETIYGQYEQAILTSDDIRIRAFTVKNYAALLSETGRAAEAEDILTDYLERPLASEAKYALQNVLCSVWMGRLTVPYDETLVQNLKSALWDNLQYFEQNDKKIQVALTLMDAAQIANISDSFAEGLGYITRAVQILDSQDQPALVANAQMKKGILLYAWAQSGQPQFYKAAMDALLSALKVFKRDDAPQMFADIQHYLGNIYAEIPDEVKKKSIWAAVSVSSFAEALKFYTKEEYPYEYAMICHNQGNAYTKYPASLHSDNLEKALLWYNQALDIRTRDKYPIERDHTLSNYLEVSWRAADSSDNISERRYNDMYQKALEMKDQSVNSAMAEEAEGQLRQLEELKLQFAN